MKISKYFTDTECTRSATAIRHGVKNEPTPEQWRRIKLLMNKVMDRVRELVNSPITPSSVFRSEWLNAMINGSATSQHVKGEACDFLPIGWTVKKTIKAILNSDIPFDQLIDEYGEWVHISYTERKANRHEILVIRRIGSTTTRQKYTKEQYLAL